MKLSFSTLGCPAWSFQEVMDNAARMGYEAIELRGIGQEMRSEKLAPLKPENRESTQAALAARGLSLCCLDTSVSFNRGDDTEAMLEEGFAAVEICEAMSIPFLRVFGNNIDAQETEAEAIRRVSAGISRLCGAIRRKDVYVLLEVHGDYDRVSRLLPIFEGVAHPQLGLLWDIMNSDLDEYDGRFAAFYKPLAPYIRHIHVKDSRNTPEGRVLCPVGEGDIPIAPIVSMLLDAGYDGYFSLEWEKRWHQELPEPEAVFPAYVAWMRDLPISNK